ncbi:MAG: nucleoside monophosphate kinase [Chitinophagaceae bacterium]
MKQKIKKGVFVIGPPGSGKSSVASFLEQRYSLKWVSMGKLLRKVAYNKKDSRSAAVRKAIESGKGASDKLILSIYKDNIKTAKNGVVLDGNPGGVYQAQKTISLLKENNIKNIFCIRLTCLKKICVKRIIARDSSVRKDGSLSVINKRFAWYKTKVMEGYKTIKKNSQLTVIVDSSGEIYNTTKKLVTLLAM